MKWPTCLSEAETVDRILGGDSLSRFGDGELAIALGRENTTHARNPILTEEFRRILIDPLPGLLVAIPTLGNREIWNYANWARSIERYMTVLDPSITYGSAFVGRPKTAPWTADPKHLRRYRSVWHGRRVVAVGSEGNHLRKLVSATSASYAEVTCPALEAYSEADRIIEACLDADADLAVLAAGPAATAIAARLCSRGLQAIDLGRGAGAILKTVGPEG